MTQIEEINEDRRKLEAELTRLVNEFQVKHDARGAYSATGLGIRITHGEQGMARGKHFVQVSLSF